MFGSLIDLKRYFLDLIDWVKNQDVDLEKVITDVYDFRDAAKAFEDFSGNGQRMLKVMIDFTKMC